MRLERARAVAVGLGCIAIVVGLIALLVGLTVTALT